MILCHLKKKLNMNAPADSTTEISFPDSLLNLAQWLDSQDEFRANRARNSNIILCNPFVCRVEWELTMDPMHNTINYYNRETTNSERVLAVLMLREMVLAGDI